jgi:hypothetical protein
MKVQITLTEELLGTASNNPELHREFIASNAPDAAKLEDEVAALGTEAVADKSMTVFPKLDGKPFLWDYQVKGFFKDACGMLSRVPDSKSGKLKAWRKVIDGLVFVEPRKIALQFEGALGNCQRPLRAQTAQGERVALAESETVPAGAVLTFQVILLNDALTACVREWLDYGARRGLGQWRNSGKGRFTWREL